MLLQKNIMPETIEAASQETLPQRQLQVQPKTIIKITESTVPTRSMTKPNTPEKAAAAYRTISEVANTLNLPTHVLRFWETKFSQISPMKRTGGRRYYRPEDVQIISRIQDLLHNQGYTIKGVQQLLQDEKKQAKAGDGAEHMGTNSNLISGTNLITNLANAKQQLHAAKQRLQEARQ